MVEERKSKSFASSFFRRRTLANPKMQRLAAKSDDLQPGERKEDPAPSKVALKIRLVVAQKFTSWYHQKGTLKKPTIALMQEPDSDLMVATQTFTGENSI
jgi:hypothetical protein